MGSIAETPDSLTEQLQALRTMMESQKMQFDTHLQSLRNENRALQAQLQSFRTSQESMNTKIATVTATETDKQPYDEGRRPRPTHPDVESFTDKDLKNYQPFCMNLRMKFVIDEACFYINTLKMFYIYSHLQGRAAQRILPWLSAQDANGVKFNDLIAVMNKAFCYGVSWQIRYWTHAVGALSPR
jgi:hypothetical protein